MPKIQSQTKILIVVYKTYIQKNIQCVFIIQVDLQTCTINAVPCFSSDKSPKFIFLANTESVFPNTICYMGFVRNLPYWRERPLRNTSFAHTRQSIHLCITPLMRTRPDHSKSLLSPGILGFLLWESCSHWAACELYRRSWTLLRRP